MRAGRLDRLITIQRKTETYSSSGAPMDGWAVVGVTRRAASYRPLRGDERFSDPQRVADEQVEFSIRYSTDVAELSPLDRIIYPALSGDSPGDVPATRHIYDILAVPEIGRREGLRITAVRRADVTS